MAPLLQGPPATGHPAAGELPGVEIGVGMIERVEEYEIGIQPAGQEVTAPFPGTTSFAVVEASVLVIAAGVVAIGETTTCAPLAIYIFAFCA